MRRGAAYGIVGSVEAGCAVSEASAAQDLELEWDGGRIAWESVDVTPAGEGAWHLDGIFRVPGNAEPGFHTGPEVFCWNDAHTERTLVFSYGPGGVVVYDASVSPAAAAAGSPVVINGYSLPTQCGDPDSWNSRLSIRFDGQPRPWTSISGTIGELNRTTVAVEINVPGAASIGTHQWSIWCRNFDPSVTYTRFWERTVQVTAAPPPLAPPGAAVTPSVSSRPGSTPSPGAPDTPTQSDSASPATVVARSSAVAGLPSGTQAGTSGWPRTKVIDAIPRSDEITWPNPWLAIVGLLLLAALLFLLIGFPSELFNKTFEENEPAIRRWLHLPPKRDRTLHKVRWPIVMAFMVGSAVLIALAEPSPIFSRETLITVLALIVAVPVTALGYQYVMERHARYHAESTIAGKLKPLYPAIAVAVLCALLSRFLHFVPAYVYGLIIAYAAVSARSMRPRQEGIGVLKATVVLFLTAMLSWTAWQLWFAGAAGGSTGFVMRWLDTVLGYVALIGLEAPLLGLLPLRFMDGRMLWRWSKPLWLSTYCLCLAAFVIVLMDFGSKSSNWSDVVTMVVLFVTFGAVSFAFWGFFAIRTRRLAPGRRPRARRYSMRIYDTGS
ncbi:MAG TPA: FGLLP motif-containing membrane protein [Candidatus Limnocylindrales bacterium]|nr:FGLLP motif-containing membrane protein [Candidatus Limnocylindrales bacterium]